MKKLWLTGIVLVLLTVFAAGATYTFEEFNFSIDIPDDYLVVTKEDTEESLRNTALLAEWLELGSVDKAKELLLGENCLFAANFSEPEMVYLSIAPADPSSQLSFSSEEYLQEGLEVYDEYNAEHSNEETKRSSTIYRSEHLSFIRTDYYADGSTEPEMVIFSSIDNGCLIHLSGRFPDASAYSSLESIASTIRHIDVSAVKSEVKRAREYTAEDSGIKTIIPGGWDKETPVQDGGFCTTRFYCIDDPSRYVVLTTIDILRENSLSGLLLRRDLQEIDLFDPYVEKTVKERLNCQDCCVGQTENGESLIYINDEEKTVVQFDQGYLIAVTAPNAEIDRKTQDSKMITGFGLNVPEKEETQVAKKIILRTLIVLGLTMVICFLPIAIDRLCRRKPHKPFAALLITVLWGLASGGISLLVLHLLRSPDLIGACGVILWSVPNYFLLTHKKKEMPLPEIIPEEPATE